jgi:hypothetical protein
VAKKIVLEKNLRGEVRGLLKTMPVSWRKKINNSALTILDYVADCGVDFSIFLNLSD